MNKWCASSSLEVCDEELVVQTMPMKDDLDNGNTKVTPPADGSPCSSTKQTSKEAMPQK